MYYQEAKSKFAGELCTQDVKAWEKYGITRIEGQAKPGLGREKIHFGGNSGYQAINLAYLFGATKIVLLGYDMQKTDGKSHWHGDHPKGLHKNPMMTVWAKNFEQLARDLNDEGVETINATRNTALEMFPKKPLDAALNLKKQVFYVQGMQGLGDNLHQRAIVRELMDKGEVFLQTPWPSVYYDFDGIKLLPPVTQLRTQAKNANRERSKYTSQKPNGVKPTKVWYSHDEVRQFGSFLGAMCAGFGVKNRDFSYPISPEMSKKAHKFLTKIGCDKPLLVYRPLVERTEWVGSSARNPDAKAYYELIKAIKDQYFVLSVADLQHNIEWAVSKDINADYEAHKGELEFEMLAALMSMASLVFCSPGFALILAQAVKSPLVAVFGGHESARLYDHENKTDLLISPKNPCECFSKTHPCDKRIDLDYWMPKLKEFANDYQKPPIS